MLGLSGRHGGLLNSLTGQQLQSAQLHPVLLSTLAGQPALPSVVSKSDDSAGFAKKQ
jgi:hypothetical protein